MEIWKKSVDVASNIKTLLSMGKSSIFRKSILTCNTSEHNHAHYLTCWVPAVISFLYNSCMQTYSENGEKTEHTKGTHYHSTEFMSSNGKLNYKHNWLHINQLIKRLTQAVHASVRIILQLFIKYAKLFVSWSMSNEINKYIWNAFIIYNRVHFFSESHFWLNSKFTSLLLVISHCTF